MSVARVASISVTVKWVRLDDRHRGPHSTTTYECPECHDEPWNTNCVMCGGERVGQVIVSFDRGNRLVMIVQLSDWLYELRRDTGRVDPWAEDPNSWL